MKRSHLLIIIALFLFYLITNYFWLSQNNLPVSYDEGIHLWTSLRFVRAFTHTGYDLFHANTTHWPPLFHFTASIVNLIFGTSYIVSVMTNMLFFLLLLISLYLIGKKLCNPDTGIIAAIIVSLYPIIYGHSRLFQLDFALTSMVAFSVYALLASEGFKNRKWSIIFGITAGLGMLTKWSYVIFILPLFMYEVIRCLYSIKARYSSIRLKGLLISSIIASIVTAVWYLVYMEKSRFALGRFTEAVKTAIYRPMEQVDWLMTNLNNHVLSFLFFGLFIICLIAFYISKGQRHKAFITIWYLVPIIALSFLRWKQPRFFMPVLPCFAIISAIGMDYLKNRRFRNLLLVPVFTLGLMQFFDGSFGHDVIDGDYNIVSVSPPHKKDWKHAYIAEAITGHAQRYKWYPLIIGVIYEDSEIRLKQLFANHIMNYFLLKELLGKATPASDVNAPAFSKDRETREFIESIPDMLGLIYVSRDNAWPTLHRLKDLLKTKPWLVKYLGYNPMSDQRLVHFSNSRKRFKLIEKVGLPFSYFAYLYLYDMPEIKKDRLSVRMFNGKTKIFYKGKEITKDRGLMVEFGHKGKPDTYKEGRYSFHNILPHQTTMVSEWPGLGVKQSILVSLDHAKAENTVNIRVTLEARQDIALEDWRVESLFSDGYKEWIRDPSKGAFKKISIFSGPDEFEVMDTGGSRSAVIGLERNAEEDLPGILFSYIDREAPLSAEVISTGYSQKARGIVIHTVDPEIHLKAGEAKEILEIEISIQ